MAVCDRAEGRDNRLGDSQMGGVWHQHGGKAAAMFIRMFRCRITAVALACTAIFSWGSEATLFIPLDAVEAASFPSPPGHRASLGEAESAVAPVVPSDRWLVRVDRQRLFRTIHAVERSVSGGNAPGEAGEHGERLVLNVADGFSMEVAAERTQRTLSGHSLSGRVVGTPGSAVTFAVAGEMIMGTVWTPKAIYEVFPLRDGVHLFRKTSPSAALPLGAPIRPDRPEGGGEQSELTNSTTEDGIAEGGAVVDVLVLWTPTARENVGGEAQMHAGIDHLVTWTNDAYERSGAKVRLNLVGAEEVDYVEADPNSATHLHHLANPSDGFMDGIHMRRDALGADLVHLVTGIGYVGGKAYQPGAFSLSVLGMNPSFAALASTFAHELGHNMGLAHDRYRVSRSINEAPRLSFSYGYVNKLAFSAAVKGECWVTIMAYYERCSDADLDSFEVPYFSTPERRYPDDSGAPLGVPKSSDETGADGPADAVYGLNIAYPRVVSLRPGRTEDGGTPETATPVVADSTTFAALPNRYDIDYFRVTLPEAGWLRVETTGRCDTQGALITEDGEVVAEDNTGGAYGNFLIEAELGAGVYFVKVQWAQGTERPASNDYTLRVSFKPASAADDHGDGAAQASYVAVPSSTSGAMERRSDTDYFRFEVGERSVVRIGTAGQTDVVGVLTSADGTIRLEDDDSGPTTNFLIVAKLSPGIYFVAVRGYDAGAIGAYSLNVSRSTEPDDHADAPSDATALAAGAFAEGEIEVALDHDLFRIEIPAELGPGQLWVESQFRCLTERRIHCDAYVAGELLQDGDVQIAARTGDGGLLAFRFVIGAQVAPGPYFLRVTGVDQSTTGTYEIRASFIADNRTIPLFLSASRTPQQGFARIINRSRRDGQVVIHAVDDAGKRFGPVTLSLAAGRTAHFNSNDLEAGNAGKGLSGGIDAGTGDRRLELETVLDIEALAYVRTEDGFLTTMHDAATNWSQGTEEVAAIFNPASNRNQRSKLRLTNQGPGWDEFNVRGFDDRGWTSTWRSLRWELSAGKSLTMNAAEMEDYNHGRFGSLGDGFGKWRLSIVSDIPIKTMNLLESSSGHVTNLTNRRRGLFGGGPLPFFLAASPPPNPARQSFARVINHSRGSGEVSIHAVDDSGRRFGPVTLSIAGRHALHFNSGDLENGNRAKGLSGSIGAGEGDWRLEFDADFDIEALAYVRTDDGFLTSMNTVAPKIDDRLEVVFFNPASNDNQVSRLRLINPAPEPAAITITGMDDAGAAPPQGDITLTLPAGAATSITAQQLEAGADHFTGRFGDGEGKWQLFIEADQDVQAMSLLESPDGHITNLSSGTAVR